MFDMTAVAAADDDRGDDSVFTLSRRRNDVVEFFWVLPLTHMVSEVKQDFSLLLFFDSKKWRIFQKFKNE
jgi:hypothetical protein